MKIPENHIETSCYRTWMGEDGICWTKVKAGSEVTKKDALENSAAVTSYYKDRKYPLIVDSRGIRSISKEARDHFSLKDRPSPVNAIAIIIDSPVSRVIGNFFIGLSKTRVPSKLFLSESEAAKWANFFLDAE